MCLTSSNQLAIAYLERLAKWVGRLVARLHHELTLEALVPPAVFKRSAGSGGS
jgi:hypothetical protein